MRANDHAQRPIGPRLLARANLHTAVKPSDPMAGHPYATAAATSRPSTSASPTSHSNRVFQTRRRIQCKEPALLTRMPSVDHARPSHSATLFAPALPQEVLRVNVLGLVGPLESGLPHQPIRVPVKEEPAAFAGRAFMDRVLPRFGPEALVVGARLCFDPLAPQVLDCISMCIGSTSPSV